MRRRIALFFLIAGYAAAASAAGDDWPTSIALGGVQAGVKGLFQYDLNDFGDDRLPDGSHRFEDARTLRRKEVDLYLRKDDLLEIQAGYDFQPRTWLDNYVALNTGAGRFRLGQFKTQVGWEDGNTGSGATTFLERSLPEQAVHEGRRVGLEWSYAAIPHWLLQLAYFGRHDLNDDAAGATSSARAVYTPVLRKGEVLHLGLTASRENRDDRTGRVRARPEVNLTDIRLVDTGNLKGVDRILREGLEAGWLHGPLLLQGEYLSLRARRWSAPDFTGAGYYVSASWLLTGESRSYRNSGFGNPAPARGWGAFELAARYAALDLNDAGVQGGRERDATLGLNWYLGAHFKLQANYIRVFSSRGTLRLDPHVYALRAQLAF
ncbi:OprO/OprP family phosphate-selective porin [Fulvimonas soli]|uniref:Phosphate-selective porin OprO/OprP n=1 Tax=Fulvimonas soli TaxID=155197 RepID=A0A316J038_9GAMM|nr:porin [Fulvimonas soli]PWK92865.1 phosphate-selective porin OprO/OprP [Fulvimonas soli]TNY26493.1 hypothetical protein BV497_08410 [Fulvimonas soli]